MENQMIREEGNRAGKLPVSVIIVNYNAGSFLADSICTALPQALVRANTQLEIAGCSLAESRTQ